MVLAASTSVCSLPDDMVHNILSVALAEHFDSLLLGPESRARLPFCSVAGTVSTTRSEFPNVAESLLLVSRQFYRVTLHVLSAALSIPFRESSTDTRARLEEVPWIELSWIRKLRNLVHNARPSMQVSEIGQLGAALPLSRCALGRGYRAVMHLKLHTSLPKLRLHSFPSIGDLQDLQRRRPTGTLAPKAPDDISQLPDAFRSVLLKQFDMALAEEAIFYGYELYVLELALQWSLCMVSASVARHNNPGAPVQPHADRIQELIEHIRDADSDMRTTWQYAVPLDCALGSGKLTYWSTLLRRIAGDIDTSSPAKDAARALLQDFELRIERLQQGEGTMAD
ncbi:hypothetical protein PsYK624_011210 [Phanerochaete sordida]|uniref:Uncharacterized protein n=1 Tax=Phanerochaete sordida TaxID=48140 RepID=A0A9P3L814_9APHY|nr:hypothetical protein PsYK624_011210 [Phanerochaete sordida]